MQPLRMVIRGDFWDTQIYQGRLYLFTFDGLVRTYNWDRLINEWPVRHELQLALNAAFRWSDYLYGDRIAALFDDDEIRQVVESKFERLSRKTLRPSRAQLAQNLIGEQESPFPFPHTDSTIYMRRLWVASDEGVHSSNADKRTRYPVGTRPRKYWDADVVALAALYGSLALATGDDGLFELPLRESLGTRVFPEPQHLLSRNCTGCNWNYYSIYGSSHDAAGALAAFRRDRIEPGPDDHVDDWFDEFGRRRELRVRRFDRVVDEDEIFGRRGYSWGTFDKLCQASRGRLRIVRYQPWEEEESNQLVQLGDIAIQEWKGNVVSGAVAPFGTVVEYDNALVVVASNGEIVTLPGEPVNWRVFPRARHYANHLHVVYDDRLEILSFNHDYFVPQADKLSGIRWTAWGTQ